ncbi:hypothetical protein P7K49_022270 [Saguinus oedipus]|uniref:Uncharacterized protein n=1 Tax=Saguinus oedipus TaxID=9490 RepID=A0ABQ9UV10_SAGOE|nr:hypothetical protein P7K49_022270 [Saguinus oedipus]
MGRGSQRLDEEFVAFGAGIRRALRKCREQLRKARRRRELSGNSGGGESCPGTHSESVQSLQSPVVEKLTADGASCEPGPVVIRVGANMEPDWPPCPFSAPSYDPQAPWHMLGGTSGRGSVYPEGSCPAGAMLPGFPSVPLTALQPSQSLVFLEADHLLPGQNFGPSKSLFLSLSGPPYAGGVGERPPPGLLSQDFLGVHPVRPCKSSGHCWLSHPS